MINVNRKSRLLFSLVLLPCLCFAQQGEELFLASCAECHQSDGTGLDGIYPSLVGNELVLGNAVDLALVLIIGRGEMPSFAGAMPSEDMAAIINYVRTVLNDANSSISASTIDSLQQN